MDSAGSASPAPAPVSLDELLQRHEHMLMRLSGDVAALSLALAQRTPLTDSPPPPASPADEPIPGASASQPASAAQTTPVVVGHQPPSPELFHGELDKCAGFLTQLTYFFRQQIHWYPGDGDKISFFVQLLRDRALQWAQAVLRSHPDISYPEFLSKFKSVFDKGSEAAAAAQRLLNLKQGRRRMSDYSVDFWVLAEQTGWGQEALKSALLNNICDELKGELIMHDLPASLDSLMTLCIKLDDRLQARRDLRGRAFQEPRALLGPPAGEWRAKPSAAHSGELSEEGEQPMQLGRSRLTPAERQQRMVSGECLYCGRKGHFIATCPSRPKGGARP